MPCLNLSTLKHVKEYTSQSTVTLEKDPNQVNNIKEECVKPDVADTDN